MNFRKSAKGGAGVIFNPKIYVAGFGHLHRFFRTFSEKFATQFSKEKGGGSKADSNFSENSSVLVAPPVPNHNDEGYCLVVNVDSTVDFISFF